MTYEPDDTDTITLDDRLDMAGDWLTEVGMRLIVDTSPGAITDVWAAAEEDFGQAIALIHAPDGIGRYVEVHWWALESAYATAIVEAFNKAGCVATWDGGMASAITVDLNI